MFNILTWFFHKTMRVWKGYIAQHCLVVMLKNSKNRETKETNLGPFSLTKRMVLLVFIIEIFKKKLSSYLNGVSPHIMNKSSRLNRQLHTIWGIKKNYIVEIPRQWLMGLSQSRFMAPKIWSIVPQELTNSRSLYSFKKSIRKWKSNYPCRLCKIYLQHVGFI